MTPREAFKLVAYAPEEELDGHGNHKALIANSIAAMYARKIEDAFRDAYDRFAPKWREEKKKHKGKERPEYNRDVLQAFAEDILDIDRSTAGRYIAGEISGTSSAALDLHLRKLGKTLRGVAATTREIRKAVMTAQSSAMLKIRDVQPPFVQLNDADVERINDYMGRYLPDDISNKPKLWESYLYDDARHNQAGEFLSLTNINSTIPSISTTMLLVIAADQQQASSCRATIDTYVSIDGYDPTFELIQYTRRGTDVNLTGHILRICDPIVRKENKEQREKERWGDIESSKAKDDG